MKPSKFLYALICGEMIFVVGRAAFAIKMQWRKRSEERNVNVNQRINFAELKTNDGIK